MTPKKHTIDAKGKSVGRIATQAATILRGKDTPSFEPNKVADVQVSIVNASKVVIGEKKLVQTIHVRYSGFPGGIKRASSKLVAEKKGRGELVRKAIYRMLPDNKLRDRIMKNLTVTE